MKKFIQEKHKSIGITAFIVVASSMLFFIILNNIFNIWSGFKYFIDILSPVIIGLCLAYLLNPILNFLEQKICVKIKYLNGKNKLIRIICLSITILFSILVLTGFFWIVIPSIISSIYGIISNLPNYINNLSVLINTLSEQFTALKDIPFIKEFNGDKLNAAVNDFMPNLTSIFKGITIGLLEILNFAKNFLVGFFICFYFLLSKEKFFAQTKRITYALLSKKAANAVISLTSRINNVFSGFILGKILDSIIIGIMCYIGLLLLNIPYALLISLIVGVTNVIPFFGPFIGAIPSGLLILFIDPIKAVWFGIFILVLQQFDGNILGPKILGQYTGLSSFWVIISILVGGGLFGFMGMFIGVPTFAVIYALSRELIEYKLKKKNLPTKTDDYYTQQIDERL